MNVLNEDFSKAADEFSENTTAYKMIARSLGELAPRKGNRFALLLSAFLAAVFAAVIARAENTVSLLAASAETILNIQLTIFSVVLTIYSLIFVFFDREKLKLFAKGSPNKETFLSRTISFFQSAMFLFFVNIAVTGLIVLMMGVLDSNFRLTDSLCFDTWFAGILMFVYFGFSFRVFYETKSIIYNIIQMFRLGILLGLRDLVTDKTENGSKKSR